jgi:hypothetical protein
MARLVILNGHQQGAELELHAGRITLGRADDNDFSLPEGAVSNHHCELEVTDAGTQVKDLGSTNGTFIDGQPVEEAGLRDGQILTLGDVAMRLVESQGEGTRPSALHLEPDPEPATLENGRPACLHHPDIPAVFKCPECHQTFCMDCVRQIRLVRGQTRHFCPKCSAPCTMLPGAIPPRPRPRGRRLWETIRMGFRWK